MLGLVPHRSAENKRKVLLARYLSQPDFAHYKVGRIHPSPPLSCSLLNLIWAQQVPKFIVLAWSGSAIKPIRGFPGFLTVTLTPAPDARSMLADQC